MRHLTLRGGRLPFEVVGDEVELLAVEHRGDCMLVDPDLLVRPQAFGELIERAAHLGADVGDQFGIEQQRLGCPTQRLERLELHRCEGVGAAR